MFTEFISFQSPPGSALANYDRNASHTAQPDSIPQVFLEAMSIREEVFVKEQDVPLENELDSDDCRSYHWVTYASVGAPSTRAPSSLSSKSPTAKKDSTASRLAVGTVRLVPPPHPPHPHPGSEHQIDNSEDAEKVPATEDAPNTGPTSSYNPHNEPYIKIGRLAILKSFRGMGLGKMLFNNTLQWAAHHPETILPPPTATEHEMARMEGASTGTKGKALGLAERWQGLVLVHAQRHLEQMYLQLGFETDAGLGEWLEEGIPHIGMWKRLKVKEGSR